MFGIMNDETPWIKKRILRSLKVDAMFRLIVHNVIASAAKQSKMPSLERLDCHASCGGSQRQLRIYPPQRHNIVNGGILSRSP